MEKSQSQAIRIYEQHKEERIEELNKELAPLYMQAFHIGNVQKQIANSEKQHFFSNGTNGEG